MDNIAHASSAEVEKVIQQRNQRLATRQKINNRIADDGSLLGSTSDISHLLLHELSIFVNKLSQANSLAEMRASTESLKNAIGAIEGKVASGEVELPYQIKGQTAALDEALTRAHGVSNLLK
ncbi:hypothetical protein J8M20_21800 [Pseudoalteromonas luteoviolacea]|uniref:hypothetical protein n=1 Tax=Pseudoalteromonas luteoviolacea TaxID=43657 RepID=UPI001B3800F8|nr:hypothetical protein [Pseudoalteromonas luteoviolacea]MBQ4814015.1 hypothetical protein [Pseudoalteromonas luteoviolacea]